jgi:ribosomal protein L11 methyltransferase
MRQKSYKVLILRLAPQDLDLGLGLLYRLGITSLEQKRNKEGLWLIAQIPVETTHRPLMSQLFSYRNLNTGRRIFNRLRCQTVLKGKWAENYKKHLKPFPLVPKTQRQAGLWIDPRGLPQQNRKSDTLYIEPGLAFGTGLHPTTELCAQFLAEALKENPGATLLDLGCGTGILGMVGCRLGSPEVWGVDVDPIAAEVAKKNVKDNGIRKMQITDSLQGIRRKFDGIVSNILLNDLVNLKPVFEKYLRRKGFLILSGLRYQDGDPLLEAYKNFLLLKRRNRKGWTALLLQKN